MPYNRQDAYRHQNTQDHKNRLQNIINHKKFHQQDLIEHYYPVLKDETNNQTFGGFQNYNEDYNIDIDRGLTGSYLTLVNKKL